VPIKQDITLKTSVVPHDCVSVPDLHFFCNEKCLISLFNLRYFHNKFKIIIKTFIFTYQDVRNKIITFELEVTPFNIYFQENI